MMRFQNKKTRWVLRVFSVFLFSVATISLSGCGFKTQEEPYAVSLEMWGVFDDTDAFQEAIGEYLRTNPHVRNIEYRKMSVDTYEKDLLEALATGNGPDIFLIRNSWLPAYVDKVAPADPNFISERSYRDTFVDVATDDFFAEGKAYAVPLSVDSLGLYYNKSLLNAAGVSSVPRTWPELARETRFLTKVDEYGNIIQSGAALGTAYNINRSTDILSVFFLQFGARIDAYKESRAQFQKGASDATEFYTAFAKKGGEYSSWDSREHYSLDAFYEGELAYMINYSWHAATIRQKNAKLDFGVAPLPQFEGVAPVNFANYWGFAVAKNKVAPKSNQGEPVTLPPGKENDLRVFESWQFLRYLSFPNNGSIVLKNGISGNTKEFPMKIDPAKKYLEATGKPAARRDLIASQRNDVWLGPFAEGNLIAKSFRQFRPEETEKILAEAIDNINRGALSIYDALSLAETRINQVNIER